MTSNTKFVCHLLLEVLLELTNHLNMCCLVNLNVNKISLNRLSCRSNRRFNLFTFVFSNLTTKTACIQVSAAAGGHTWARTTSDKTCCNTDGPSKPSFGIFMASDEVAPKCDGGGGRCVLARQRCRGLC